MAAFQAIFGEFFINNIPKFLKSEFQGPIMNVDLRNGNFFIIVLNSTKVITKLQKSNMTFIIKFNDQVCLQNDYFG